MFDHAAGEGELSLGRAADPWRASAARSQNLPSHGIARYLPGAGRRPTQSWRTFIRNQAGALHDYSEQRKESYDLPNGESFWAAPRRPAAAQIASGKVGLGRDLARPLTALNAPRLGLRPALCERAVVHRVHRLAASSAGLQQARSNRFPTAAAVRSPPYQARASPSPPSRAPVSCSSRGSGIEKPHPCAIIIQISARMDHFYGGNPNHFSCVANTVGHIKPR